MPADTCDSCQFFASDPLDAPRDRDGECRRRSPEGKGWPWVRATDWCGRFRLHGELVTDRRVESQEREAERGLEASYVAALAPTDDVAF